MLNRPIDCRQADAAAPAQFKTPQAELEHLRKHDRTLKGFARALRIIDDTAAFGIQQGNGGIDKDWLDWLDGPEHRRECSACVGAYAHWFFDRAAPAPESRFRWDYHAGEWLLNRHLGCSADAELRRVIMEVADPARVAKEGWDASCCAFGGINWPVCPAAVFDELARRHPGK